ncbi:HlyD family efflux transporter periplasmic adaptor subunit [Konateibacter massiliensis]|uniref:HlyD family efflux transporter periplasmic adaptor subunit n=1 Tax=Konateibacter massiliensis TaxID=2002841 RepID=UPI0015D4F41F|nr:HlyD family efflux transporter periplasmic adaptor subunit [Konateibacter massiliensis]
MSKLKEVFRKMNKKVIALVVVVVLVITAVVGFRISAANKMQSMQQTAIQTETIEKRTLTNSISATGTIEANDTQTEQTSLTSYEITAVNVEVGDRVSAGDVIATFDVSSIQDSVTSAQKSLDNGSAQNNLSEQSAERSLAYAQTTRDAQAEQADSNVADAESNLTDAQNTQTDLENDLDSASDKVSSTKDTYSSAKKAYTSAKKTYDSLTPDYNSKNTAYETAKLASEAAEANVKSLETQIAATSDATVLAGLNAQLTEAKNTLTEKLQVTSNAKSQLDAVSSSYNEAKAAYEKASAAYEAATTAYETAKANKSSLETQLASAEAVVDSAQKTYDNSVTERDSTNRSNNNTVSSQQESLASTRLSNETSLDAKAQELEKYEEQLEKGNVTARISGVVTAVNVSAGDIYAGGDMFTIKDDSSYVVETTVDEYDIGDLYTGMSVIIKTNATGEEELNGTITYISPTPKTSTSATTSTSSDVTYEVKVSVDTPNDKIRLGMTAKLSIVLETKENVYAVPYDAVTTVSDTEGTIQVVTGENQPPVEMKVTLGMETDYYMEIISDEITEGMSIVVPSTNADASQFMNMGPMGGF